jgi:hypothetical protein
MNQEPNMKRLTLLFVVALLSVSLAGAVIAKGGPSVVINGGGIAENSNHGLPLPTLLSVGGFTAHMKGDKVKGQVQSKSVVAEDPTIVLGSVHGRVVCMMDLGDDTWEVRFEVTKASGFAAGLLTFYGSLFVKDGGTPGAGNDWIDEGFADPEGADCGGPDADSYNLEPVVAGNFNVHEK